MTIMDKELFLRGAKAYALGDMSGRTFEGGGVSLTGVSFERIRARTGAQYTDETDLLLNMFQYSSVTPRSCGWEDFLLGWSRFITHKRGAVSYGKTWRGFFSLVQALQKEGALSLDRLYTIAADYPSFGNGVFCAVLPLYLCLIEQGIGEDELFVRVDDFARLTHAHPNARQSTKILISIFELVNNGHGADTAFDPDAYILYEKHLDEDYRLKLRRLLSEQVKMSKADFIRQYPLNVPAFYTLAYALYTARNCRDIPSAAKCSIGFGGDADSVCALALMLTLLIRGCEDDLESLLPR